MYFHCNFVRLFNNKTRGHDHFKNFLTNLQTWRDNKTFLIYKCLKISILAFFRNTKGLPAPAEKKAFICAAVKERSWGVLYVFPLQYFSFFRPFSPIYLATAKCMHAYIISYYIYTIHWKFLFAQIQKKQLVFVCPPLPTYIVQCKMSEVLPFLAKWQGKPEHRPNASLSGKREILMHLNLLFVKLTRCQKFSFVENLATLFRKKWCDFQDVLSSELFKTYL